LKLNFSSNQCNANIILNRIPRAVVLDPSVNIKLYSAVSKSSIAADTKKYAPSRGTIPILKERTHLPIIVDPSHAIGQRDKVTPLAKAAKAVGAHGIMVEFHPEPNKALSDGQQSLDFNQFENLMAELTVTL